MSTRKTYTPDERRERLDAAQEELAAAVERISTGDEWRAYLDFASRLHNYSARNCFWLMMQATQRGWDELGYVAGFHTWLRLDRHVRKGEKGLRVLAPCRYKTTDKATGEEGWLLGGFKVESVFAQGQTDGDGEIPERIRPELLTGEGPDGAWDALAALVEAQGYSINREPLAPANGTTSYLTRKVVVADRLEDAAAVKTLAHELAHVLLHENADYHANRGRCECEAESVAYLVCGELGLATDAYTFAYVATWAEGDVKVVMAAADNAKKCAARILDGMTAPVAELVAGLTG